MNDLFDYDVSMLRDFFDHLRLEITQERIRIETGDIRDISDFGKGLDATAEMQLRQLRDKKGDAALVKQNVVNAGCFIGEELTPTDDKMAKMCDDLKNKIAQRLRDVESAIQTLAPVLAESFELIEGGYPL